MVVLTEEKLMNPVGKALWYIESHLVEDLTLDEIANVAGVSRYYISRMFGLATGLSITRYIRGRRLTEAARTLAKGVPDILTVALESGYGSHEAFTRAFRDQFGLTPEAIRTQGSLSTIEPVEPIKMDESLLANLHPPRFENGKTLLIAGLGERYSPETSAGIPAQWQRFAPHIGHVPGQIGNDSYGVICNGDDTGNIEYISGVEVSDFGRIPGDFSQIRVPKAMYAVFFHKEHITTIRSVWLTIHSKWIPESGYQMADTPSFERYDERFDPSNGMGGFEIWIPIKDSSGR